MSTARPADPPHRGRAFDFLFRIRTRLLLVHAFLVVVPLAGLEFARTYERELLRGEEEGMTALAIALAAATQRDLDSGDALGSPTVEAGARAAARALRAQIRVLDADGRSVIDTGPEQITVVTSGRKLLTSSDYLRSPPTALSVGDPAPPSGTFAERPEVKRALAGRPATYTRVPGQVRGVRLYVAEPVPLPAGGHGVVYISRTTYPVLVSLYRVRNGLERVALVSFAVALVVSVFLGLTISRPLRKLTDASRRIAAGERGVELKLSGRDEIAGLARTFDAMARALDARLGYISELAANVSHEFKTPIASIRGAAELLRDGAADDPEARPRFLENILADTDRLARLVSRLLELSRIESTPEAPEPIDYRALVEEVVGRYQGAGQAVTLDYQARYAHLLGQAEYLDTVLTNLLDNAVQFSPAGRKIVVKVTIGEAGFITTEVTDEGRGISPGNLARVWDRFFTTARSEGGTGLGLAIVRAIVGAHGGQVSARSTPGEGSTFSFTLPRRL